MGWATKKGPPTGSTGPTPPSASRLQLAPLQLRHVTLQPRQALHHRARRRQRRGAHWRRRHGANDGTRRMCVRRNNKSGAKIHGTWMNRSEHGFKKPMISWTLMDTLMDFQNVMCQKMSETMRMRGFPDMFMPTIFYECQLKGSKMFQNHCFQVICLFIPCCWRFWDRVNWMMLRAHPIGFQRTWCWCCLCSFALFQCQY